MTSDKEHENSSTETGLFRSFLEEADEMLAEIETTTQRLENEPSNLELVDEIFRVAHSLKGNSSFFNFINVKKFCHTFESFLSLIRERTLEIDDDIVKRILEGVDLMKSIFIRLTDGNAEDVTLLPNEETYLQAIGDMLESTTQLGQMGPLQEELTTFFDKARREDGMEEDSPIKEVYDIINRHAPVLVGKTSGARAAPGSRWLSGKLDIAREYGELKNTLKEAREGTQTQGGAFFSALEKLIAKHWEAAQGDMARELENVRSEFETFYQDEIGMDEIIVQDLESMLAEYQKKLTEIKVETSWPKAPGGERLERKISHVRVDESVLDIFLENVGELITLSELFNYLQRRVEERNYEGLLENFRHTNNSFRDLSQKLQESLYEIRKAPVEGALARLPRILRNVCRETGKEVRLSTSGGATEVDKSMLEKLETMLVHMVINSADHGIETPEERKAVGKQVEGKIDIKISSDGLNLNVEVSDDGRGVALDQVRQTAVQRKVVLEDVAARLSDKETLGLILRPGFSTRHQVTERSGRGVGLDVVTARVREMGGSLSLANMPGEGFKVTLSTPLAYVARIKLGLSMKVGSNVFLVPAEHVRESFRAAPEEVTFVEDRGEVVRRMGQLYPVVRLHKLFKRKARHENVADAILVLVESGGQSVCLMVDEMLGQRQIVYKRLTVHTTEPSAFEGVSILDGTRMALILSVDGVIRQFQNIGVREKTEA
ncbi:MAG: chemotaxis protein CheA, partial [Nitrospinota bacterium]|nr:chemotaxis protein CheA [Nitrospinota bacterium]